MSTPMPSAFISYVRDNSEQVDKLTAELRQHGVTVWLDRDQIMPGMRWQDAIRQAIQEGDYFIACFSAEYVARPITYMNTEIGLAIEMLMQMPTNRIWFIPVLLSECQVPGRTIGGGQTLRDLQWEPLHKDWERGTQRILKSMGVGRLKRLVIDKPVHLELIGIPAGPFLMGNDLRRVEVAEFYIGKYPITNAQYAAFVQARNFDRPMHWEAGRIPAGKENHPAVGVVKRDAVAFCEWLSQATGRKFRLPAEEEWEKAARGGLHIPGPDGELMDNPLPGRPYPWGNQFDADKCNTWESKIRDTTPVGKYSPAGDSPYGVSDMIGNVWEWCSVPSKEGHDSVFRGDSWCDSPDLAAKLGDAYGHSFSPNGFRVVAALSPPF